MRLFSGVDQSIEVKRASPELEIWPPVCRTQERTRCGPGSSEPLGYQGPAFTHTHRLYVKAFGELAPHRLDQLADTFGKARLKQRIGQSHLASQDLEQVVVVPASSQPFGRDAPFERRFLPQRV